MKSSRIGLTLGKFAPLHRGHQYMIETAIKETEKVIVIVYDAPEVIDVPLNIRAGWIRRLYPEVEVIEGWNAPNDYGDTPEVKKIQETYILKLLNGRKITHFYSSEFYGEHMSMALGAINRIVDEGRLTFPVSGTSVRKDPFANRNFISDVVYKDLIINIVFMGAPSTGKTTLAEELSKVYNTEWMPEYGKEYWEKHQVNRRLTLEQLAEIAEEHIRREEEALLRANKYLFTDTNAITTFMFSKYYHGKADERLIQLTKLAEKRYDLVFLCDTDIPYDDTWDRSGDVNRKWFQQEIIADLNQRKISFIKLQGDLRQRVEKVQEVLKKMEKQKIINLKSEIGGKLVDVGKSSNF